MCFCKGKRKCWEKTCTHYIMETWQKVKWKDGVDGIIVSIDNERCRNK